MVLTNFENWGIAILRLRVAWFGQDIDRARKAPGRVRSPTGDFQRKQGPLCPPNV